MINYDTGGGDEDTIRTGLVPYMQHGSSNQKRGGAKGKKETPEIGGHFGGKGAGPTRHQRATRDFKTIPSAEGTQGEKGLLEPKKSKSPEKKTAHLQDRSLEGKRKHGEVPSKGQGCWVREAH